MTSTRASLGGISADVEVIDWPQGLLEADVGVSIGLAALVLSEHQRPSSTKVCWGNKKTTDHTLLFPKSNPSSLPAALAGLPGSA